MRNVLFSSCLLCLFFSCSEGPKKEPVLVKGTALASLPVRPEKVRGMYTGDFKGSPISLVLNYVSHQHASGYNVHKGLMRNLSGTIAYQNGQLQLQLSEPGNNQYDGQFTLLMDTSTQNGSGTWKPFKEGKETSFTFKKREIEVDLYAYGQMFFDSTSNYLTLKPDGSCSYSYLTDTTLQAEQLTIRGNYIKDGETISVYWQKNEVFPSGKSIFKLVTEKPYPEEDYEVQSLKGEGRVFTEMMF